MIALGATVINNSRLTPEETSARILNEVRRKLADSPAPRSGERVRERGWLHPPVEPPSAPK
jgi:hypothetical protein